MHSYFPGVRVSLQYSNLNMELFSSKPGVWPRIKGHGLSNWTLHTYEGYLILKKAPFVFVRTSSIKIVMNVNEPTWWIANKKKKRNALKMLNTVCRGTRSIHFIFKVSLMSLFCLFLSLSSLSSPAETNLMSSLLLSHHWIMEVEWLQISVKIHPYNWLEMVRKCPQILILKE